MQRFKLPSLNVLKIESKGLAPGLEQDYKNVNFYTGSTSCCLLHLQKLNLSGDKRILIPSRELVGMGYPLYAGELGNTFLDTSINKNGISGCEPCRAKIALDWAKTCSEKRWIEDKAHEKMKSTKNPIAKTNINLQIEMYQRFETESQDLINNPFPIVLGFQINNDKLKGRESSISGEFTATGGCTYDELEVIFVPQDKIELVKTFLPKEKNIKINSIETLEEILSCKMKPKESSSSESSFYDSSEESSHISSSPTVIRK